MNAHTSSLIRSLCITFVQGNDGQELINKISPSTDWSNFISAANEQRLLPLAYWTFKRLGIEASESANRVMASAYLRQKFIAKKQIAALLQVLAAFSQEGIDSVVLKGGALATKLYPEPGLRPMDDIDILVPPNMIMRAREVLLSLGYDAPLPKSRLDHLHHHLPIAIREDSGVVIGIELHHDVFHCFLNESLNFSHLTHPLGQFQLNGVAVPYLGESDLIWMQYRGLRKYREPLRKLHLIDIALIAERLPNHWQGPSLKVTRPDLWNALVALDNYLPFSGRTRRFLGFSTPGTRNELAEGADDINGWPPMNAATSLADWMKIIWPSRTWAKFLYGLDFNSNRWQIQKTHARMCLKHIIRRAQMLYIGQAYLTSKLHLPPVQRQSTILVTCMYNGLAGSRFGGRLNRVEFYRESLATIARASQLPILCFVSKYELEAHQKFFLDRVHNITWVTLELTDFPHSDEIQHIKSNQPEKYSAFEWQERCVEIMWGKFHLLKKAIKHYPHAENIFWIDAGLANISVISTKYTCTEALRDQDFHRVDSAFSSRLFSQILEYSQGRIMALSSTTPHNPPIPERYNEHPYANDHGLVGGLFGGNKRNMKKLCNLFEEKCKKILLDDMLYFEESIMSGVFADHPELFKLFAFDTWYHEGWDSYDHQLVNFSSFFDLMLDTPPIESPLKISQAMQHANI